MTGGESSIPGEGIAMRGGEGVAMPKQNDGFTGVPPRLTMVPRQDQQRGQALVRTPAPGGWWQPTVRTLGVEEELLLAGARTGRPLALAERVRSRLPESGGVGSARTRVRPVATWRAAHEPGGVDLGDAPWPVRE
jgi:hypothetical protein